MAVAVDWLRRGDLDAAIVGAVDLASDDRAALARQRLGSHHPDGSDSAFCTSFWVKTISCRTASF